MLCAARSWRTQGPGDRSAVRGPYHDIDWTGAEGPAASPGSLYGELGPGDYVNLAAHTRHRVAWTTLEEPTVWLAIHH